MKKKNLKLNFNKETVSLLNQVQQKAIKGGDTTQVESCCQPLVTCNSTADPTGALSGCPVCK